MAALTMRCASRSDTGRRANNEDAVYASSRLAAVADGVGGAEAGEVASRWAISAMESLDKRWVPGDLGTELRAAVMQANDTLGFLVACRPEWTGMATTLTAVALSDEGEYLVANVGDSRTYLLRDGALRRLTRDQSLVQELIDRALITAAQARVHPRRSVVLQALDGSEQTIAAPGRCRARPGDRLLLCSDGVSDFLADDEIAAALRDPSREAAAEALVTRSLLAGGGDNISAVVADIVGSESDVAGWAASP